MPHMIEKREMARLQDAYPEEWARTSARRFRSPDDMQYAFAYMYWLIHGGEGGGPNSCEEVLRRDVDVDDSGLLSENELVTLAAVLKDGRPTVLSAKSRPQALRL